MMLYKLSISILLDILFISTTNKIQLILNKSEYVKSLSGKLPEEDRKDWVDFIFNDLSARGKRKPTGNLSNYAFIHKDLGWGLLKIEGKYGLENTESYTLVKFTKGLKIFGMKAGISTAMTFGEILTGDELHDDTLVKGITSSPLTSLTDSEKEFFEALKNFNKNNKSVEIIK